MSKALKMYLLKEICNVDKGKQIDTNILDDTFPYRYINGGIKESGYYKDYNIEGETILISEGGASCGYINYINEKVWHGCHCYALSNFTALPKYLFYALKSNQHKIMALRTGAAMPNIKKTTLQNMELTIHEDFDTQKKITDELDKITSLIEKRKTQIEKLDLLVKAKFIEMFKVNNFDYVYAEEVCDFITKGTTPKNNEIYKEFSEEMVPYLKVYNLSFNGNLLFDEKPQYISKDIHNNFLKRSKVVKNDVLMNIVGPPLGKFSIIKTNIEYNINQAIAIFRAKDKILPIYLLHALMQPETLNPFVESAVGVRQQNLSLLQCRKLKLPLPPIKLQDEFSKFVETTEKTKENIQKGLTQLETLYKQRMQEYFE